MVKTMENPMKHGMIWAETPLCLETSIYIYTRFISWVLFAGDALCFFQVGKSLWNINTISFEDADVWFMFWEIVKQVKESLFSLLVKVAWGVFQRCVETTFETSGVPSPTNEMPRKHLPWSRPHSRWQLGATGAKHRPFSQDLFFGVPQC